MSKIETEGKPTPEPRGVSKCDWADVVSAVTGIRQAIEKASLLQDVAAGIVAMTQARLMSGDDKDSTLLAIDYSACMLRDSFGEIERDIEGGLASLRAFIKAAENDGLTVGDVCKMAGARVE